MHAKAGALAPELHLMPRFLPSLAPLNDAVEMELWFFHGCLAPLGFDREPQTGEWLLSSSDRAAPLGSVRFFAL